MPIKPSELPEIEARLAANRRKRKRDPDYELAVAVNMRDAAEDKRRSHSWEQQKHTWEERVVAAKRDNADACIDEAKLHAQIIAECERRRWAIVHNRMDRKSTATPGCPDFVIFGKRRPSNPMADGVPQHWLIECKTRTGKLSADQQAWHYVAQMNGLDAAANRFRADVRHEFDHPFGHRRGVLVLALDVCQDGALEVRDDDMRVNWPLLAKAPIAPNELVILLERMRRENDSMIAVLKIQSHRADFRLSDQDARLAFRERREFFLFRIVAVAAGYLHRIGY